MSEQIIPFSHLALGGKFRYIASRSKNNSKGRVYVKISNIRDHGCIAEWDEKMITSNWLAQGIYSLNDTGKDIDIEVVL